MGTKLGVFYTVIYGKQSGVPLNVLRMNLVCTSKDIEHFLNTD